MLAQSRAVDGMKENMMPAFNVISENTTPAEARQPYKDFDTSKRGKVALKKVTIGIHRPEPGTPQSTPCAQGRTPLQDITKNLKSPVCVTAKRVLRQEVSAQVSRLDTYLQHTDKKIKQLEQRAYAHHLELNMQSEEMRVTIQKMKEEHSAERIQAAAKHKEDILAEKQKSDRALACLKESHRVELDSLLEKSRKEKLAADYKIAMMQQEDVQHKLSAENKQELVKANTHIQQEVIALRAQVSQQQAEMLALQERTEQLQAMLREEKRQGELKLTEKDELLQAFRRVYSTTQAASSSSDASSRSLVSSSVSTESTRASTASIPTSIFDLQRKLIVSNLDKEEALSARDASSAALKRAEDAAERAMGNLACRIDDVSLSVESLSALILRCIDSCMHPAIWSRRAEVADTNKLDTKTHKPRPFTAS